MSKELTTSPLTEINIFRYIVAVVGRWLPPVLLLIGLILRGSGFGLMYCYLHSILLIVIWGGLVVEGARLVCIIMLIFLLESLNKLVNLMNLKIQKNSAALISKDAKIVIHIHYNVMLGLDIQSGE